MATTFRYTFSNGTAEHLSCFATIHKHEERKTFKESWETWVKENSDIIENERTRLEEMGYNGDLEDKMFKSVRYYYRKKSFSNNEPKKRRTYIKLDKDIHNLMESHICDNLLTDDAFKPSNGYNDFYDMYYQRVISFEVERIVKEHNIDEDEVEQKIKKTYKNKFFNLKK
tara:strand:+ start:1512 stop:2021 length:510 start_codon:yes stop_codon:yes gene_type:complete